MLIANAMGVVLSGFLMLCPPAPEAEPGNTFMIQSDLSWAVMARDLNKPAHRPDDDGATAGLDPTVFGQWTGPINWDVIAIHAALLPSGQVLHYSYPWGTDGSRARIWDPVSNKFSIVDWSTDIFCSGLTHQPDGQLLVVGGNDDICQFQGRYDITKFNPFTGEWSPQEDMIDGRWYPSPINMYNGSTLLFSGLDRNCTNNPIVEVFTPESGVSVMPNGDRLISLYPRMHLLTNGKVAHVGPENGTFTFDLFDGWEFVNWNNQGWRSEGTSVLVPGRTDQVMIIGGYIGDNVVTNTAEIIDFSDAQPTYQYTGSLNHGRAHADTVILPDKTVMLVGGGQTGLYDDPIFVPELYDPDTGLWTELAPHFWGRMYHATSVLLPDGRVIIAGQDSGPGNLTAEVFEPPYLFQGTRPVIYSAPSAVQYNTLFPIIVDDAEAIDSVVLIKLTSNTHSVNFDQRLVEVPFIADGPNVLFGAAPQGPSFAPPGYYMLFTLSDGVPSVASMIRIQTNAPADFNGDGVVGIEDMLQLLSAWGPCGDCIEDLNGDGFVDVIDLLSLLAAWS